MLVLHLNRTCIFWNKQSIYPLATLESGSMSLPRFRFRNKINRGEPTRGGHPAWSLGEDQTPPHRKKTAHYEMLRRASGGLL